MLHLLRRQLLHDQPGECRLQPNQFGRGVLLQRFQRRRKQLAQLSARLLLYPIGIHLLSERQVELRWSGKGLFCHTRGVFECRRRQVLVRNHLYRVTPLRR